MYHSTLLNGGRTRFVTMSAEGDVCRTCDEHERLGLGCIRMVWTDILIYCNIVER